MKSLHSLLSVKRVAAAIVGGALVAPAIGIEANRLGTADDGMICRSGYTGALSGSAFKCSKSRFLTVNLECTNPTFQRYVIRPAGSAGTPQGRDICTRNAVNVGSTDSVVNLVQGQDYVLAAVNATTVNNEVANLDQQEASALGLDAARDVDTTASDPLIQPDAGTGSRDRAVVQVIHYTFAIPTGGLISAQR
jgi:hypothetical protein